MDTSTMPRQWAFFLRICKNKIYIVIYFTRDDLTSSMKAAASSCKADEQKRISSKLGNNADDQRCTIFLVYSAHLIVSWDTACTWLLVFALAIFSSRSVNMDILSSFRSTISSNWVKLVNNSNQFINWQIEEFQAGKVERVFFYPCIDLTVDFLSLDCRIFMSRSFAVTRSFCNLSYASANTRNVTVRHGYSVNLSVMPSVQSLTDQLPQEEPSASPPARSICLPSPAFFIYRKKNIISVEFSRFIILICSLQGKEG